MTILQRAATFAAMTLAIAGLVSTSTPGQAAELTTAATTAVTSGASANNLPGAAVVPATTLSSTLSTTVVAPFATLAAAVAAQDVGEASEDLECLAGAIYYEAKGEPLAGQLGVAEVIINRSRSGRFAEGICSVVTQRGQFSFVRNGRIPAIDTARATYRTALAVAKVALADLWDSPADNALYFNARRPPAAGLRKIASIGNHHFYR